MDCNRDVALVDGLERLREGHGEMPPSASPGAKAKLVAGAFSLHG